MKRWKRIFRNVAVVFLSTGTILSVPVTACAHVEETAEEAQAEQEGNLGNTTLQSEKEETVPEQKAGSEEEQNGENQKKDVNAFSTAGNGQVQDSIGDSSTKEFYTIKTKNNKQSAAVILDQYGKLIADHCKNGFDEDAKRKIREISGLKERLEKNENTGFAKRMKACYIYLENENCLHNVEVGEGKKDDRGDEGISDLMQKQGLVRIKRKKSVLGRLYNKKCEVAKKWGRPLPGVKIKRKSD